MTAPVKWDASHIPSLKDKTAIVTGANTGIGFATALRLAEHGARVIVACRSEERGRQAVKEMQAELDAQPKQAGGSVEFMKLDLSSMAGTRRFAEDFNGQFNRLDLLINNAAVVSPSEPLTVDGVESQFAVNHVNAFLLTTLLFGKLKASPAARVVSVSSDVHQMSNIDFPTLVTGTDKLFGRYARSKLANLLFTYELGRRLESARVSNIISVSAHPGTTATTAIDKAIDAQFPGWLSGISKTLFSWVPKKTPDMGALPILYAATAEDVRNSEFFGPTGKRGHPGRDKSHAMSHSKEDAKQLWELCEELTKTSFNV
ncbi:hypothetical protein Poli38472_005421 [Pythium oligandrum]|uniref:Uncharacterized protein n=1 Tax=Pythium oligandrum TaxID=41045 RepID=A0A8K1FLL3_PYTOL|nr:hypothetical protein Poli38472_005421 [Pythium oligandrum]|eukprot:TMW62803.1 hypothetical protein Poli38472_005421 [Pythium oligandrum]